MIIQKSLSKKQLRTETNCPGYIIDYLNDCGRLPIAKESEGPWYPTLYHPDAVNVINEHLAKRIGKDVLRPTSGKKPLVNPITGFRRMILPLPGNCEDEPLVDFTNDRYY